MDNRSFRLYIIGKVSGEGDQYLTTFAEYGMARALSRRCLTGADFKDLSQKVRNLRSYVEAGAPILDRTALAQLGSQLFDVLLADKTRDLFIKATGDRKDGVLLPLEVVAEDPEVAGWPWEYLYDSSSEYFLSQEFYPISRSIFTSTTPKIFNQIDGKVRLLLILGVPPDDPETTPLHEVEYVRRVFKTYLDDHLFDIDILDAGDQTDILSKVTTSNYDIVHYFGHAGYNYEQKEGYLSIRRPGKDPFKLHATLLAGTLLNRGIRLVFLNACKTAVGSPTENPARSSIAAALLDRGIPAVIASQFSLPDVSAHFLASTVYNTLLTGKPIGDAIRDGRNAMSYNDNPKFFDWGIPVLYSTDPSQPILSIKQKGRLRSWAGDFLKAAEEGNLPNALVEQKRGGAPSLVAEETRRKRKVAKVKVALVDIDSKVGFLPELVEAANRKQAYYHFEVIYKPVPSGYVRSIENETQTYLPRLSEILDSITTDFSVDCACCLTTHMVATEECGRLFLNRFGAPLPTNQRVLVVSTFQMREYAKIANVPFAKAVFVVCLSMIVQAQLGVERHTQTAGCLFDLCENRDDIIIGLKKMRFDHEACREKIHDRNQLAAIDKLATLTLKTLQ